MKRNILKKIAAVFLLTALLLPGAERPAFAAGAETSDFTIPAEGYDGEPVTITFYHTMGANLTAVLDNYIAEFNKLYPNITIEYTSFGNYDDLRDRIGTEIALGDGPNIAYCYPDHVAFYNLAGAVLPLDALINDESVGFTEAQKNDFIPSFYNEGKQFGDGKMYTLPLSKNTEVLYYNKTFFEEHDLTVPTTWEEMEATCAAIKAIDPYSIPLGYDSDSNWFITLCEQYGSPYTSATGDHYLFDNAINRGFVKMLREWYDKGYLTTQQLYGAYTSGLFTTLEGIRSYMSIASSSGATYQRPAAGEDGSFPFEVGIATIPQVDAENPKVTFNGPSLCIFQKDNAQEVVASWLFVKFLITNVEFQSEFGRTSGYVPVLKSVSEDPVYAAFLSNADGGMYIAALSAKVCLEQESAYFATPAFCGSSTAHSQVGTLLSKCLTAEAGDVDVMIEGAFRDAVDKCEELPDPRGLTGVSAAAAYLQLLYQHEPYKTPEDFTRVGAVRIGDTAYTVNWSADTDAIRLSRGSNNMVTMEINTPTGEDVAYTLTATVSDGTGNEETVSFAHNIPANPNPDASYEDIVRAAYGLNSGESFTSPCRLLGTVTRIDTPWSEDYQNITVTIRVGDLAEMPIMCYRLQGEDAENIVVGDSILVQGYLKNYKGTIEFDQGCVLLSRDALGNAVRLDRTELTVNTGITFPLTASCAPEGNTLSWQSSDEAVATVSESGEVTAIAPGTAVITATYGTASTTCTVTVRACPEEAYTLNEVVMKQGNNVLDGIYPFAAFDVVVSITENEAMEDAVILVATYTSEGKMLEFHILPMTFQTGIQQTAGVEIDNGNCNIGEIRVFVLSSLSGLVPLTECKSLK